ncbi:hypothetical protein PI124_g2471 [Phytophthora idaei]|nr:hypothetical protein PI125_g2103 [Phytophthora idaei]KAG3171443.1 hypothetical protein PI126_g1911 [Phytophthora idaei]KAG3252938.1 hypothetical protein PI124_g2471 [Phytophthora idaei]
MALFYDLDVPEGADQGGEVSPGEGPRYEQPARPEAAVPIGEARQRPVLIQSGGGREALMSILTGIASVLGLGEPSDPRSRSGTPERVRQRVRTMPQSAGSRPTSTAGTGGPTPIL